MTITLERLVDSARARAEAERAACPQEELRARIRDSDVVTRPPGRLRKALERPGMQLIAEVKGASPLSGVLRSGYDPSEVARAYVDAGAAAVSVLTEETYFGGSLAALEQVAACVPAPVLRKDFIVMEYQVQQAALAGAGAVLLIAEVLSAHQLADLVGAAHELRLDALVEIHRRESLPAAMASGSGLVGVNNRDLETMEVDWRYGLDIAVDLPIGMVTVTESGISDAEQLRALAAAGYDAALVGSALMRAGDPGAALAELVRGTSR